MPELLTAHYSVQSPVVRCIWCGTPFSFPICPLACSHRRTYFQKSPTDQVSEQPRNVKKSMKEIEVSQLLMRNPSSGIGKPVS